MYKGTRFRVERAPEPTDILWENIGEHVSWTRRVLTTLSTLTLLVVSAVMVFYSVLWKKELQAEQSQDASLIDRFFLQIMIFIPSLVVILINELIALSIKILSNLHRYPTTTE
jgi:hypothetical protein